MITSDMKDWGRGRRFDQELILTTRTTSKATNTTRLKWPFFQRERAMREISGCKKLTHK